MAPFQCLPESITVKKTWPYFERYHGEKDEENRRSGHGEYHWGNAESLEWYEGPFFRDTMHGWGTYRWRWLGAHGDHISYEGYFFTNKMHGYGTMSYPDGRTFQGLFYNDLRWGPGIMRYVPRKADVGLWYGNKLIRLAWLPPMVPVVPDIASTLIGPYFLEKFRTILTSCKKNVGDTNSTLDLLSQQGVPPLEAEQQWSKLFAKYCTDMESVLCHKTEFLKAYYGETMDTLEENAPEHSQASVNDKEFFYAWNNDPVMVHMMRHAFLHERQRSSAMLNLKPILCGPRRQYPSPGPYELNCRITLMASYLGDKRGVFSTIQENNVYPNITDVQGNTAIMYATCGNQTEIIHYLVEAGARVDTLNDACMTPLSVALLIYALAKYNVPLVEQAGVLVALTSLSSVPERQSQTAAAVADWFMTRTLPSILPFTNSQPQPKTKNTFGVSPTNMKKIKSQSTLRTDSSSQAKRISQSKTALDHGKFASDTDISGDNGVYYKKVLHDYEMRIGTITTAINSTTYPKYLFEVRNMMLDVDKLKEGEDHVSKTTISAKGMVREPSKKKLGKASKSKLKVVSEHKELGSQSLKDDQSIEDHNLKNIESLKIIRLTILQLLLEGADPRIVRVPRPALALAVIGGSAEIVQVLVTNGADVNERCPELLGYTPLHFAVSRPFSQDAFEVTKALLVSGANCNERILGSPRSESSSELSLEGPTLIHALVARSAESEVEEEFRKQTIALLLDYGCNPYAFYEERSPLDYAAELSPDLLDVFISSDAVSLNGPISSTGQSLLAKLMSAACFARLTPGQTIYVITNLLTFGADPLLPVKNGDNNYDNIFVYAREQLEELRLRKQERRTSNRKDKKSTSRNSGSKRQASNSKTPTSKTPNSKSLQTSRVSDPSTELDINVAYEQVLEIVAETARRLHVRWIRANLVKELARLIESKRIDRPWSMIMRDYKNEKRATVWLTAPRCLETWQVLQQASHPVVKRGVLKQMLAIVHYYRERRSLSPTLNNAEKEVIDKYVDELMSQPMIEVPGRIPWRPHYNTPELLSPKTNKFNVCLECSLPLTKNKVECEICTLVAFCNSNCMWKNTRRLYCHPCSPQLVQKHFQRDPASSEASEEFAKLISNLAKSKSKISN